MLTQRAYGVHDTGLIVILLSDGTVAISMDIMFGPLYDYKEDGVHGIFTRESFSLKGVEDVGFQSFDYGVCYPYKNTPVLKAWLSQQDLTF